MGVRPRRTDDGSTVIDALAERYRAQARRYYPGSIGLTADDCDGLVDDLAAAISANDPDRPKAVVPKDLDPAGWLTKALTLALGRPTVVAGVDLVEFVDPDMVDVIASRAYTVHPDGTITPADTEARRRGSRPTRRRGGPVFVKGPFVNSPTSRRASTSSRAGTVSAAPGGSPPSRGAPHP